MAVNSVRHSFLCNNVGELQVLLEVLYDFNPGIHLYFSLCTFQLHFSAVRMGHLTPYTELSHIIINLLVA